MKWSRLVLIAAVAQGCAPKEIAYDVTIVTKSCEPSVDSFAGVNFVRVRVTGDGITEAPEATSATSARLVRVPSIPVGTNRIIEVRGYDADPTQGAAKLLSLGRSLPFDVPDAVPAELVGKSVEINIVLRKVNSFTKVALASNPTQCMQMRVARAGHTATVLKNGKVFIAGGYNIKSGTVAEKKALADTEIFDPNAGTFTEAKDISFAPSGATVKLERAFHTATLIPSSGQVVLWGGESYQGASNTPSPTASFLFYDPEVNEYGALPPRSPAAIARSHHAVALDANGKMLIVGGTRMSTGSPVNEVEWLDPASTLYKIIDGVNMPRLDMAVAPVKKGAFIAVAGGTDGTSLVTEVSFFKFNGTTFAQQAQVNVPHLADPGRRAAAAATIRDGADLLLVGGYEDAALVKPVASSEIINSQSGTIAQGPPVAAKGDSCAALLTDGSVLVTGGRTADMPGAPAHSVGTTQIIKANLQGGTDVADGPSMSMPRYGHTCTSLPDGTVLVTGGVDESTDGVTVILQDAWIYQPNN